jgi:hypothetical protein
LILAAAMAPLASCAPVARDRTSDLVVYGLVEDVDHEVLDEWGINVAITAKLSITRVVRGTPPSRSLTIKYITHSGIPPGHAVRLRLRYSKEGYWLVCAEGGRGYRCP